MSAIRKREQIYGELGLPASELEDLKRQLQSEGTNTDSYVFFKTILLNFRSRCGTLNNFIECLKKLELISAVGKLVSRQPYSNPNKIELFLIFQIF